MKALTSLPVDNVLAEVTEALRRSPGLVLRSPTGSGKTTRVPPHIEEAGYGPVILVQPRRLAARAAARRMASERGERLGARIGYRVRFDSRVSAATRITAVTQGVFLRRLLSDPLLEGVGTVVFDEFHERQLDADLGLALLRKVQREVREDLRIVILSATLDPGPVAAFLGAEVLTSEGRLHPVEVRHHPSRGREPLDEQVERATLAACAETPGDVLVFLPGKREIRQAARRLAPVARAHAFDVHTLHGDLTPAEQDRALARGPRRRVVLSTNIAESSVTIQGVSAVIDSGLARTPRFDASTGLDRLELGRISLESVRQRAGRAGREAPGWNYRLWSALDERSFAPRQEPEVTRVDLAGAWLSLLDFGETQPEGFPWFEQPTTAAAEQAVLLLGSIGAIEPDGTGRITALGRELADLPLHPRLGRLLLAGREYGCPERAALAAALISERDSLRGILGAQDPERNIDSDVLERVELLEDIEAGRLGGRREQGATRQLLAVRDQLRRSLEPADRASVSKGSAGTEHETDGALLRAVFVAFADRLARKREDAGHSQTSARAQKTRKRVGAQRKSKEEVRALLTGGRGVRLAPTCRVRSAGLFVCVELDAGTTEGTVRLASCVEREWLDEERMRRELVCSFDAEREEVRSLREVSWNGLLLHRSPVPDGQDSEGAARELEIAARAHPARAFDLEAPVLLQFHARLALLATWLPELELEPPAPLEWVLRELPTLVRRKRSFRELRELDLAAIWRAGLEYAHRRLLATEVPERFQFPGGSSAAIRYSPGKPPVLAARIQQFFGVDQVLSIAHGRVRLLLHLTAPNGNPEQVTDDLPGFWRGSYARVRKTLKGRYPKHAWPEDPLSTGSCDERAPRKRGGKDKRRG